MKSRLNIPVFRHDYKGDLFQTYNIIIMSKIEKIIINNKTYFRNNYMYHNGANMTSFYIFIKKNIKNISFIETEDISYLLKNGTLHDLYKPAKISTDSDNGLLDVFYFKGVYCSSSDFFRLEDREILIKQKNRIKKIKEVINLKK